MIFASLFAEFDTTSSGYYCCSRQSTGQPVPVAILCTEPSSMLLFRVRLILLPNGLPEMLHWGLL